MEIIELLFDIATTVCDIFILIYLIKFINILKK